METRRLGRTGHHSSLAVLGGAAFALDTPETAEPLFQEALACGLNHLDIAPGYRNAERAIGPHLPAVRDQLFVAAKTAETERDWALSRLEKTLTRLQIDHLDLYQAHGVTSLEELDRRDEAFQVILEARDQGLTRFVGITGHDLGTPKAQQAAVERYDLDTVMFPLNAHLWANPTYRADAESLLETCAQRDVGVMIIKATAWRPWGDRKPDALSWYEPHRTPEGIQNSVNFALSVPRVHAFCTPSDPTAAQQSFAAAQAFTPLSQDLLKQTTDADTGSDIFPLAELAVSAWA